MSDSRESRDGPRRRHWTGRDETPSGAVVEAVASASGTDAKDLPPLGDRLDTDSLDGLFASTDPTSSSGRISARTADMDAGLEVRFEYAGYDVTVADDDVILE
ncbi:HalOD1 output domain-containing protein [Halorussus amylolyticus]|uniref:HalOD1 output domain-containing protein n=1 Tax=Halorussus amylolyticus TaxID=1126242 RepID=UPI00104F19D4|nr:HalOD1 output domain-containing protein [Halorussus amylolyticus]